MLAPDQPSEELAPGLFLHRAALAVTHELQVSGLEPNQRVRSRLAQFWFGDDPTIHYELWIRERQQQIELGLHFEATPALNRELLRRFDRRLLEIQSALGRSVWLEEWDRGWARLYETQPLLPLNLARAASVGARMREIVEVVQPILEFALQERAPAAPR